MVDHLWAGWRMAYIQSAAAAAAGGGVERPDGCTLFEAIHEAGESGEPDQDTFIVWRGEHCFALLNAYPYTSGHLMVLPKRGVAQLGALRESEHRELWDGVRDAVAAVNSAYSPDGVNVGLNLGTGAGAGVPDHLHVHVVPRWEGDTNFMTTVANTRVLPEPLVESWRRISTAWP